MKILVTGANGYLGQGIVKRLLDDGNQVIAVDFQTDHVDQRAVTISCNLFEVAKPFEYFDEPDIVLHLAWRDGFVHYSNAHIEDLFKHYKFIKLLEESGLKRIAVMGSMHEIGFFEGSINENTPCNPITPYGISKNALRELTEQISIQNHVDFQWLRGYYIVGNSQFGSSVFSKIYVAAKEGKKEFPFTQGQNQYDFIDYEDFCKQVVSAVEQDEICGIINICSGKPEKLADRAERFICENDLNIKLNYGEFPDRPYDSKAVWGDNGKIEKILNSNTIKAH
ncbi:MAG: NAD(P)-dependent oxidoreductase [Bacteroides thetaiotaomicron]|nr:NAD(P)-dependent oxidoreductase [Bacteroides thetaiotaomicron]